MSRLKKLLEEAAAEIENFYGRETELSIEIREYIDLEEAGRLMELPCKKGDTVWVVGSKCLANHEPEEWCEYHDCDECIYDKDYIVFREKMGNLLACKMALKIEPHFVWGETVFATKAEAEAKLEELKGGAE